MPSPDVKNMIVKEHVKKRGVSPMSRGGASTNSSTTDASDFDHIRSKPTSISKPVSHAEVSSEVERLRDILGSTHAALESSVGEVCKTML